jgi:hypothetical protein
MGIMTVIYNAKIAKAMSGGDIDTSKFAASIAYYKATTSIQLRNEDGEVISSMDASDFIVDGMVESVEIVDDNLVIHFNTDAGKEDITIPISDIFDPSKYSTTEEVELEIDEAIEALHLGDAAQKDVDGEITAQSDANVPTSSAVKSYIVAQGFTTMGVVQNYVEGQNFATVSQLPTVSNAKIEIMRYAGDTESVTFTLNQSYDNTLNLYLGEAAKRNVDTAIVLTPSENLPTSDAVKAYVRGQGYATIGQLPTVNNARVTIKKNDADTSNPFSFTLNQSNWVELNLGLGAAAFKAVDSSISGSSSNVPTSDAVQNYVSGQLPTVNNSTISIKRHSLDANPMTFTLNQSSGANLDIGLGDAAVKAVDGTITDGTTQMDLPTSDAVKSYIANKGFAAASDVKNSIITIERNASQSNPPTFTLNQASNQTIDLGLGGAAVKDVDTSIGSSSSSNLPTSDAVKGYSYSKAEIDSSYIVSAVFDATNNTLTLVRGDGTTLVVQF